MEPELIDPDSSLEEYLHALHASMGKAGPIIRAACRAAGMSQRELADAIGASRSAVARLEQDGPQTPWSHVVNALRVCGCTLHVRTADGAGLGLLPHDSARDRAGRRFPAHLRVWPVRRLGDWPAGWDRYSTDSRPPLPGHTFARRSDHTWDGT